MDRLSKQKINKEAQVLNDTLDEMDLIDFFRTVHPNSEDYTFFSSAHGTFSKIDYILCHKSNLSKFKKIDIISSIFSDHNAMRLDLNYKKITVAAMKLKDAYSWKKSYDNPRQHVKKQRHDFVDKGLSSQSYSFSNSHIWMW